MIHPTVCNTAEDFVENCRTIYSESAPVADIKDMKVTAVPLSPDWIAEVHVCPVACAFGDYHLLHRTIAGESIFQDPCCNFGMILSVNGEPVKCHCVPSKTRVFEMRAQNKLGCLWRLPRKPNAAVALSFQSPWSDFAWIRGYTPESIQMRNVPGCHVPPYYESTFLDIVLSSGAALFNAYLPFIVRWTNVDQSQSRYWRFPSAIVKSSSITVKGNADKDRVIELFLLCSRGTKKPPRNADV
jgi:hypothetical protein